MFTLKFQDCSKKQQNIFNAMGSMYAATMFLGVQNASSVQPIVDVERTVFYRERTAGMYSALSYAFAQVIIIKYFTNLVSIIKIQGWFWVLIPFPHFGTGYGWATLCFFTSCSICCHSFFLDGIWMDYCQILLVSIFHVLHIIVLHIMEYGTFFQDSWSHELWVFTTSYFNYLFLSKCFPITDIHTNH